MPTATRSIVDEKFKQWVHGKDDVAARRSVFEGIREIPYAVVPELIDAARYPEILSVGRGSCSPKHFLLADMFSRLGLVTLFTVFPFRWGERAEVVADFPQRLLELARQMPLSHHLACRVEIDGRLVLVDATMDSALARADMPVNLYWDGKSDTGLPMTPLGPEEIFHPSEAHRMQPRTDAVSLAFYDELNARLEEARGL
jgi:hypothetical protein